MWTSLTAIYLLGVLFLSFRAIVRSAPLESRDLMIFAWPIGLCIIVIGVLLFLTYCFGYWLFSNEEIESFSSDPLHQVMEMTSLLKKLDSRRQLFTALCLGAIFITLILAYLEIEQVMGFKVIVYASQAMAAIVFAGISFRYQQKHVKLQGMIDQLPQMRIRNKHLIEEIQMGNEVAHP